MLVRDITKDALTSSSRSLRQKPTYFGGTTDFIAPKLNREHDLIENKKTSIVTKTTIRKPTIPTQNNGKTEKLRVIVNHSNKDKGESATTDHAGHVASERSGTQQGSGKSQPRIFGKIKEKLCDLGITEVNIMSIYSNFW